MRTFNGQAIFISQLTNYGELDARYVKVTGNFSIPYLNSGIALGSNAKPTQAQFPGVSGQLSWDTDSLYICVSGDGVNGLWKTIPFYSISLLNGGSVPPPEETPPEE